jgi:hypothetical protein
MACLAAGCPGCRAGGVEPRARANAGHCDKVLPATPGPGPSKTTTSPAHHPPLVSAAGLAAVTNAAPRPQTIQQLAFIWGVAHCSLAASQPPAPAPTPASPSVPPSPR